MARRLNHADPMFKTYGRKCIYPGGMKDTYPETVDEIKEEIRECNSCLCSPPGCFCPEHEWLAKKLKI